MNWAEFLTRLRGHLAVVQDENAGWYTRFKAGMSLLVLIQSVLPDQIPFGSSEVSSPGKTPNQLIDEFEAEITQIGMSASSPTGKIGDGKLLKLLIPLVKQILPIILPLLI